MNPPKQHNGVTNPVPKPGHKDSNTPRRPTSPPTVIRPVIAPRLTNPVLPTPPLPRNPFTVVEELIMEGFDCLGQTPPDVPGATKCLVAAQGTAMPSDLPERLRRRMRFFSEAVERTRKELLRDCVDRELQEVKPLLAATPPRVDRAAQELQTSAALLKEAPDPELETELGALRDKIAMLEERLRGRKTLKPSYLSRFSKLPRSAQFAALLLLIMVLLSVTSVWMGNHSEKKPVSPKMAKATRVNEAITESSKQEIGDQSPADKSGELNPVLQAGVNSPNSAAFETVAAKNIQPVLPEAPEPASLRLKALPEETVFSVVYASHDTVSFGTSNFLSGLKSGAPFKLIAEHKGYLSVTNDFTLKPGEVAEFDVGRLQPAPASLMVLALPHPFEMQVEWDGQAHYYGTSGTADGLPPGKPLLVTVVAEGCEAWETNVVLEPAESRTLSTGKLPQAQGYLVLNCEPRGTVSYSVDGGAETVIGLTDVIPSLPLGHQVSVTVARTGYMAVTKTCLFERSGAVLDLGKLKPSLEFLGAQLNHAAQTGDIAGIDKIVSEYSGDYPRLVDQPAPEEGDAPTPLLAAVRRGQTKVVDYLVKAGANVNRANRYRVTPLFEAARKGNVQIVKTLLDAHADVHFRNLSGQTPIFAVVLSSRNVEVAKLLLASGANPNARDASGETPLLLAEENQNTEILQALQHPPYRVADQQ